MITIISGVTFQGEKGQDRLMTRLYKEAKISVSDLEYVETHGTATRAGDPVEGNALGSAICAHRDKPLFIGSVKTNAGHAEGAAGPVSLAKLIYAFHKGIIIPNLNFVKPNPKNTGPDGWEAEGSHRGDSLPWRYLRAERFWRWWGELPHHPQGRVPGTREGENRQASSTAGSVRLANEGRRRGTA